MTVLKLRVETYNCETDERESVKVIDHNSYDDRVWLHKHQYWAVRNGRGVIIRPDEE